MFGYNLHVKSFFYCQQNALGRTIWVVSRKRRYLSFGVEVNPKEIPAVCQTFLERVMLKARLFMHANVLYPTIEHIVDVDRRKWAVVSGHWVLLLLARRLLITADVPFAADAAVSGYFFIRIME